MPMSIEQLDARKTRLPQAQPPRRPGKRSRRASDPANQAVPPDPRHYTKLKIVSNAEGQSILFGWDSANWRLTIWLPDSTPGQWVWIVYEPQFGGSSYVEDFDVLSNHLEGRKDDTIDLVVMAYGESQEGLCLYFPALPFSTQREDWEAYFSNPINLTPFRPDDAWQVRLGLLPKARRSVFICNTSPGSVAATRCDVDENGQVIAYPFELGPEWHGHSMYQIFEPCVAARQPESFTFDDGLVGSYSPAKNESVVKVMLPKTPLGRAWELTPLPPLMGFSHWSTVRGISTFLRIDTGEPIITFVMSSEDGSQLDKAVWVMDNDTLYHRDKRCWWLPAPADQVFPPPGWTPVRALPVQMQAGRPAVWVWLQAGETVAPWGPYGLITSISNEFLNQYDMALWAWSAKYFEASLAISREFPGETTARVFLAVDEPGFSPEATEALFVATLDNANGLWNARNLPVPPPPLNPL